MSRIKRWIAYTFFFGVRYGEDGGFTMYTIQPFHRWLRGW